jgi:hypothetical protein
MWLAGLVPGCSDEDIASLLAEDKGVRATLAEWGGVAEVRLPSPAAVAAAVRRVNGLEWRGRRVTALPLPEAAPKLEVHNRLKPLLRTLSSANGRTRDFSSFVSERWRDRHGHALRLSVKGQSSIRRDLTGDGPWQNNDCVVLELSAKEFRSQQVRRVAGAVINAMRHATPEARLAALERHFVGDTPRPLAPLAPVGPVIMHSLIVSDKETNLPTTTLADGPRLVEAETQIYHKVMASAQSCLESFVRELGADEQPDERVEAAEAKSQEQ